jgi:hypothetical protein
MSFLINPFAFAVAGGDFESIATVTVGSGGAANIEFTSIPSTFAHLQVRGLLRQSSSSASGGAPGIRFNGDTGSNYGYHALWGDGSSAYGDGLQSQSVLYVNRSTTATQTASNFGAFVVDILDYASTSKNTTTRALAGYDNNGNGSLYVKSGLWLDTSAITSITVTPNAGNWVEHSTLALYGIKV